MQTNTVQTLIEYVKDISGQSNVSNAKVIRALNFGVDHYSYLALTASGRYSWDSRNQTDVSRVTTSSAEPTLLIEDELISVLDVEILVNGKYSTLRTLDRQDGEYEAYKGATGLPVAYDLVGQEIRPLPVPDKSYTYRLTYGRAHPRFTVDNLTQSTGVIPVQEEYVALYAADRVMLGMSDSARSAVRNELTIKEQEIKDLFSKRDQATSRRLKAKIPNVFTRGGRRGNR